MGNKIVQPEGWAPAKGYANGILTEGKTLYIGGQIGWNSEKIFEEKDFIGQMEQVLKNIKEIVEAAGGRVENIVRYYDIWQDVEPKRIKVVESTRQLEAANSELAVVRERVNELQAQLRQLTSEFEQAEKIKREAVDIAEKGQLQLELAQRLINALGSEEVRWVQGVERFRFERDPLVGDALVAAAFISFLPESHVFLCVN